MYFLINNPNPNPPRKKVMKQSQDRKWRRDRGQVLLLAACHSGLAQPSYSARGHLSRSGTICYGLSPPILIKNQKMPPHTALWTRVILSFWMTLACAKWTKKSKPLHHSVFRLGASAWESELDSSPGYFRKLWNDTDKDVSARLLTLQCLGQGSPSFEIKDSF